MGFSKKKTRFFGEEGKERRLCICSFSDRRNLPKNKEVAASFLGTT